MSDQNLPDLNKRRKALGMPIRVLVFRSRVPRATVARILKGQTDRVRFGHVAAVSEALGVPLFGQPEEPELMRRREAYRRARYAARLTQGTMALEAQALSRQTLDEFVEEGARKLLSGPKKRVWL